MPYCSSVSKLAGYEDAEVEETSSDINGNSVSIEFHINRNCVECGYEASTYDGSGDADFDHTCPVDHECDDDFDHDVDEVGFTLNSVDLEVGDQMRTTDRHGKPIKSYRYQRREYHVIGCASIDCDHCGETFDADLGTLDTVAASSFESESH